MNCQEVVRAHPWGTLGPSLVDRGPPIPKRKTFVVLHGDTARFQTNILDHPAYYTGHTLSFQNSVDNTLFFERKVAGFLRSNCARSFYIDDEQ